MVAGLVGFTGGVDGGFVGWLLVVVVLLTTALGSSSFFCESFLGGTIGFLGEVSCCWLDDEEGMDGVDCLIGFFHVVFPVCSL